MERLKGWIKREAVLCIALFCAVASMFWVPPDAAYGGYLDLRVLCLLFCLMAVVLGFQSCRVFEVLAQRLLRGRRTLRLLLLVLVLLPFFASMFITNDVALLAFVPFTILVLHLIDRPSLLIRVVVLQTLAANLGSMATPVGNPQNLFLYSAFSLSGADFFRTMLLPVGVSLLGLTAAALCAKRETLEVSFETEAILQNPHLLWVCAALFVLCLLAVFHLVPYLLLTALVLVCFALMARPLLKQVDYGLLATFVCFFVFAGNVGRIPAVTEGLRALMEQNTLFSSALASQVISNVPAAILLSGFTEDWQGLLLGVNVGGLGTPIASLASLIALKFYLRAEGSRPLAFLGWFMLANLAGLAILLPLSAWML